MKNSLGAAVGEGGCVGGTKKTVKQIKIVMKAKLGECLMSICHKTLHVKIAKTCKSLTTTATQSFIPKSFKNRK